MKLLQFCKRPLVFSTLLLSGAGILSRILGFFYRIFLSHTIGAEGLGIFQLIFPVFMLGLAISSSGIHSAISKYTAHYLSVDGSVRQGQKFLSAGVFCSLVVSFGFSLVMYLQSDFIAEYIIQESRCAPLLHLLAYVVPLSSLHACLNGYFYGLKKAAVPALSQIVEQFFRVAGAYLLIRIYLTNGNEITPLCAVYGILFGEIAAVLFTLTAYGLGNFPRPSMKHLRVLLSFAVPLSISRILLTCFQSAESILLPSRLKLFGLSTGEAVSTLGIISGMALPVVMFPSVFTNSLAVMLLPSVAEAAAAKNQKRIYSLLVRTCFLCATSGLFCSIIFSVNGLWIGEFLYGNETSGHYIAIMGWLCPLFFLNLTLNSILNGLGKTRATLILNLIGSLFRLCSILFFVPLYGVQSYLFGLLASYMLVCVTALCYFYHQFSRRRAKY